MRVRNPATGRIGSVVRGPYQKFATEWYDVVFTNDLGEPGLYSQRCELRCLEVLDENPCE